MKVILSLSNFGQNGILFYKNIFLFLFIYDLNEVYLDGNYDVIHFKKNFLNIMI